MATIGNLSVTNFTVSISNDIGVGRVDGVITTSGLQSRDGQPMSVGLPVDQGPLGIMRQTYFVCVACACILGNGLTLYAVATTNRLKVKAYAFTTSLSFSDFLYGFRLCIIAGYGIASGDACVLARSRSYVRPFEKFSDYASFFNVASVAIDRFVAVVYPLHYQNIMTPSTIRTTLIVVWSIPIVLASTPYLGLLNDPNIGEHTSCLASLWPIYEVVVELMTYFINSTIVIFVYSRIWSAAMRLNVNEVHQYQAHRMSMNSSTGISISQPNNSNFQDTTVDQNVNKKWEKLSEKWSKVSKLISQQRATRTVMVLLAIYIIFWFPYTFSRLVGVIYAPAVMQTVQSFGGAVGITSMGLNVFLYNYTNKDFRQAFRRILRRRLNLVAPHPH